MDEKDTLLIGFVELLADGIVAFAGLLYTYLS